MKHTYQTKSYWKRCLENTIDFLVNIYAFFFVKNRETKDNQEPKNLLVCTLGHLGDALIVSYVFPLIREQFPRINIDVLTSEWCKPVLENNQYIRNLIFLNHFRMNRLNISIWSKIISHLRSSRSALKEINLNEYDVSIEGRISHPNGNLLCYRGRVQRRIGFETGGFGSLLTDKILLSTDQNFNLLDAILSELRLLGINKNLTNVKPYFNVNREYQNIKDSIKNNFSKPYIILHLETGKDYLPERLINKEFWFKIVSVIFEVTDYNIIICGTSQKSIQLFEELKLNLQHASAKLIDAVNKLSLDEFFNLANDAAFAITVDSLAAHFCAINCNTISFYKNGYGALYFPISNYKAIVIHNHQASKGANTHPNIINIYVNRIESDETVEIFTNSILKLISKS